MSERKVLNKYYPPDFDPSKIPRMKLAKNRQYTVRLMAPFNMRCVTCGEYIYKGKKFNARKEDVENETYLGIRIYRFYIKCTRCLQEISFKTDPKNTDYEIEAGATRNFMALKLAEEQAHKEEEEAREEEASNPMKMLENRTQQSRNEIEMLESLEELRDLNRRQQTVDYETMLLQYNRSETEQERLARQEREDEEFIKSINFKGQQLKRGRKVVEEEIIEEVHEKLAEPTSKKRTMAPPAVTCNKSNASKVTLKAVSVKQPLVLVKPKTQAAAPQVKLLPSSTSEGSSHIYAARKSNEADTAVSATGSTPQSTTPATRSAEINTGLSLVSAYSDSSGDSE